MKCPRCGFDNSPGSKFCGNCGSVIEALQVATYSTRTRKIVGCLVVDADIPGLAWWTVSLGGT